MTRSLWIGIFMPILVFTILFYTCYQYIFTVQKSRMDINNSPWYMNRNADIALGLCMMSLISYCKIMLEPEIQLPLNQDTEITDDVVYISPKEHHKTQDNSSVQYLSLCEEKGQPLYCRKCRSNKPERTHHCRECNRCSAKMDHHCIWINGCVNDTNYKYFFLFVFYVACYSLWVEINTVPRLITLISNETGSITLDFCWELYKVYLQSIYHLWRNVFSILMTRKWIPLFTGVPSLGLEHISGHWYAISLLGFVFGLALLGFTLVHFYYIVRSQTSIEHISKRPLYVRADFDRSGKNYEVVEINNTNVYDLGLFSNWCSVMGNQPFLWFVPYKCTEKGDIFDKIYRHNSNFEDQAIKSALRQRENRLNKDLLNKEAVP